MPESELDCRGLACPEPVLQCRRALDDADGVERLKVTVDNEAAMENVRRYLTSQGFEVAVQQSPAAGGAEWTLLGSRRLDGARPQGAESRQVMDRAEAEELTRRTLVFIASDTVGDGDDELGRRLMTMFLSTLPELGPGLWRVVCVNGGVRLSTPEHPAHEALRKLEDQGVGVLVCGTCLEHFGLMEQKALGQTTNMLDIVTSFSLADKVLSP